MVHNLLKIMPYLGSFWYHLSSLVSYRFSCQSDAGPFLLNKWQLDSHFSITTDLFPPPPPFLEAFMILFLSLCPGISQRCFQMRLFFISTAFIWEMYVSLQLRDFACVLFLIMYLCLWLSLSGTICSRMLDPLQISSSFFLFVSSLDCLAVRPGRLL